MVHGKVINVETLDMEGLVECDIVMQIILAIRYDRTGKNLVNKNMFYKLKKIKIKA